MDEVHIEAKDLQALREIKGQRYHMLMEIYVAKELDKLDDQIDKILVGNKAMEGLHDEIQWIKDRAQEHFLEAKRYYNTTSLDIFEDESKTKLFAMKLVVQQLRATSKEASSEDDISQTFKTKEELLELDTKLEVFVETRIKVSNYQQLVKDKYESLYFL